LFQHQTAAAWPPGFDQTHAPDWCLQPVQAQAQALVVAVVQTPARQSHAQHQATAAAAQNAVAQGASCSTIGRQTMHVNSLRTRKMARFRLMDTGKHRHWPVLGLTGYAALSLQPHLPFLLGLLLLALLLALALLGLPVVAPVLALTLSALPVGVASSASGGSGRAVNSAQADAAVARTAAILS
jgi:hypothetical protein